jgi:hypothetical protein
MSNQQTTDLIVALRALLAEFRSPENRDWLTSACADRLEAVLTEHAPQEKEPGPTAEAGARLRARLQEAITDEEPLFVLDQNKYLPLLKEALNALN